MFQRGLGLGLLFVWVLSSLAIASTQQDLESAAKRQRVAFILVMEPGAGGVDQARDLIHEAMTKVKKSVLVEVDRSDPANAAIVERYRLAGAPVPLILVAARNGVLAGGLPAAQATVDGLVGMVPSPKMAAILQELQAGKSVFITVGRKGMATRSQAACMAACSQLQDKSALIQIDADDPAEAGFLTRLKIDGASAEPVVLVVNPQGQITGTYAGAVDVASLVQAASKKAGGCCPSTVSGGDKSCPPTQK
jgi:hypothetical protein